MKLENIIMSADTLFENGNFEIVISPVWVTLSGRLELQRDPNDIYFQSSKPFSENDSQFKKIKFS